MILNSLKIVFQNIKIKLNIRTWMTLKSSVVIFQTIEPYQQMWPLQFQQPLKPQWPLQLPFCTIYISTKIFFTDISTFSVSGCWGQRMLLFWTLLDETQMPKPLEAPRHNNSKKMSISTTQSFKILHLNMRLTVRPMLRIGKRNQPIQNCHFWPYKRYIRFPLTYLNLRQSHKVFFKLMILPKNNPRNSLFLPNSTKIEFFCLFFGRMWE